MRNINRSGQQVRVALCRVLGQPCVHALERGLPSAWFLQARQLVLRRRSGEGSERWRRGLGPPREMIEDFLDHHWIFDARNHLDGTTTVLAGQDVDLEHALQPLRRCHRDAAAQIQNQVRLVNRGSGGMATPATGIKYPRGASDCFGL